MILTRKPIGAIQHSLYSKIKNQFFEDKNRPFHTKPQFINYGIDDYNYALTKGHYFETEIKREGIILYDSGAVSYTHLDVYKRQVLLQMIVQNIIYIGFHGHIIRSEHPDNPCQFFPCTPFYPARGVR